MSKRENYTTIWINKETKHALDRIRRQRETYDELLNRIMEGEGEVFVQFWSVDGTPAIDHTIVFQLGNYYYIYEKGEFKPIPKTALRITVQPSKEEKNENVNRET